MLSHLLFALACQSPTPPVAAPPPPPQEAPAASGEVSEQEARPAAVEPNRAPVILSIKLEPARPTAGQDLTAIVEAEDPDHDHVRLGLTWLVDGSEVRGTSDRRLSHTSFEKGDTLRLRVEASDGDLTTEGLSSPVVVTNTPPEILNKVGTLRQVEGFAIKAEDPDRDPLTYRLEGAPGGMTIDERGVLHYKGGEAERGGTYQVQVVVEDGDGGRARWGFELAVSAGSKGAADAAAEVEAAKAAAQPKRRGARQPETSGEQGEDREGLLPDDGRASR